MQVIDYDKFMSMIDIYTKEFPRFYTTNGASPAVVVGDVVRFALECTLDTQYEPALDREKTVILDDLEKEAEKKIQAMIEAYVEKHLVNMRKDMAEINARMDIIDEYFGDMPKKDVDPCGSPFPTLTTKEF